jgi:hypothetical protein
LTRLRLLIDASINNEFAALIRKAIPHAKYAREMPELRSRDDDVIVAAAKRDRRIAVAVDRDFDKFKPGDHCGIIRFDTSSKATDGDLFLRFKMLLGSTVAAKTKNAHTLINFGELIITPAKGSPIRGKFQPSGKLVVTP